jgi:signal transduction histidine kinase
MEQVLRVVGRELRSPMSAVRGITEFMMTVGAEDAAASERFLNEISQEVGRMTDTVENILDAAEIKSGRINWRSAEVDLPEVVDEAIASTLPLIDAARLQICHTSDKTAGPISGDVQALRRLAFNLLSHGRKHVSGGRIEVQSRQYQDADGCWAEIVVQCLGCTKISDPEPSDETLDCDSETAPQGVHEAGLGLDICRIVVAAHGGSLQVKPNPGRGPTMTARFRTDLHKAALNTQGRLAGPVDASQSTPPRRKINLHSPLAM